MSKKSKLRRDLLDTSYILHKGDKCENCGKTNYYVGDYLVKVRLTVHHINGNPADNRIENLQTLCRKCHDNKHLSVK